MQNCNEICKKNSRARSPLVKIQQPEAYYAELEKKTQAEPQRQPFPDRPSQRTLEERGISSALSSDKLTINQLKHLVHLGLRYLTKICNLSYAHGRFSDI